MKRVYGYIPDLPDHRDLVYKITKPIDLPPLVDLRPNCPKVYDQGELGSCTGQSIASAIEFELIKQKSKNIFTPSRLFIYYNERVIEKTVNSDAGAMIRDGIKSVNQQGACPETMWPYLIPKFKKKPSPDCYKQALNSQVLKYQRIDRSLQQMKTCLASGYPFVFGFSVYESFESQTVAKTGIVPMPLKNEQMMGGHAVKCVGYNNDKQVFIVKNSWGEEWGDKGYFYLPYGYLTDPNLSDDFWAINLVES